MTVKTVGPQFAGIYSPRDDAAIFAGRTMPAHCKLERRIVWNLLRHLKANGWRPVIVDDGEERHSVESPEAAMDAIFAVDDSSLIVKREGVHGKRHRIVLIGGNGIDMISDHSYAEGDPDGFLAVMEAFDTEAFE
jgi:hypothetical protein